MKYASAIALFLAIVPAISSASEGARRENPRPRPNLPRPNFALQTARQNRTPHLDIARNIIRNVATNRSDPDVLLNLARAEELIQDDHLNNLSLLRRIRNLRQQINNNQNRLFNNVNASPVARGINFERVPEDSDLIDDILREQATVVQQIFYKSDKDDTRACAA